MLKKNEINQMQFNATHKRNRCLADAKLRSKMGIYSKCICDVFEKIFEIICIYLKKKQRICQVNFTYPLHIIIGNKN